MTAATLAVAGAVSLAAAPSALLSLISMALLVAGFALRPALGPAVLASLLPFYLEGKKLGPLTLSMPELVLLSALAGTALFGLRRWRGHQRPLLSHLATPLDGPVALFLAAALLSLLASQVLRVSLRELRTLVVEPLAAYYLAAWFLRRDRDRAMVLAGLLLGGGGAGLLGLYQYLLTDHVVAVEGVRRILGPYLSPNHLGLYLGRTLPLALAVALFVPAARGVAAAVVALLAAALLLTFSLGAWLASLLAVSTVVALWWRDAGQPLEQNVAAGFSLRSATGTRRLKPAATALTALLGLVLVAVPLLGLERVWSHFVAGRGTGFIRLQLWQSALDMVRDHPLLGVGMDNFLYHYRGGYLLPEAMAEPNLSHPHNLVLNFWLEMGILGVVAAAWVLAALFRMGLRLWRQPLTPLGRAAVAGVLGATVDLVAHGLVDNSYFLVDLAFHFWISAGILVALGPTTLRANGVNYGGPVRPQRPRPRTGHHGSSRESPLSL